MSVKTILIPTDFSIRSLQMVKYAIESNPDRKIQVIQATGLKISDSITQLLFYSRKDLIRKFSDGAFGEACQVIRNKYVSQIHDMRVELFTGITQSSFNQFTTAHGVDTIYLPQNKLRFRHPRFDLTPYMSASNLPKESVSWDEPEDAVHDNHITELFENWA